MKLVNEKGKLFGIINVVDLFVFLAVLLVIGGVGWRIFGAKIAEVTAPTVKMTMTARVRGASPQQFAEMTKNIPAQLVSGNELVSGAYLIKAESQPYIVQIPTADGRIVDAVDPTRVDVIFTIEAQVTSSINTKIGTQEVRAGRTFTVKTKHIEHIGVIETLTFDSAGD